MKHLNLKNLFRSEEAKLKLGQQTGIWLSVGYDRQGESGRERERGNIRNMGTSWATDTANAKYWAAA